MAPMATSGLLGVLSWTLLWTQVHAFYIPGMLHYALRCPGLCYAPVLYFGTTADAPDGTCLMLTYFTFCRLVREIVFPERTYTPDGQ